MPSIVELGVPESPNGKPVLIPGDRGEWRRWLADNHDHSGGIWVVYRKKRSGVDGPVYDELLDEALCHGWIDSRLRRIDDRRVVQWFSPRKKGGIWSSANRARVARLAAEGLITPAGQEVIDTAKAGGSWRMLERVEAMEAPPDLSEAFRQNPRAGAVFDELADSRKQQYLWWIALAKRASTRAQRIMKTVSVLLEETESGSE